MFATIEKPERPTLTKQLKAPYGGPTWVVALLLLGTNAAFLGIGHFGPLTNQEAGLLMGIGAAITSGLVVAAAIRDGRRTARLARDEAAVSPVIGVILMVAITVVLAAVVFVLVSKLSSQAPSDLPEFSMATDDNGASYFVLAADEDIAWEDLEVSGCTTAPATGNVTAGDEVSGCAGQKVRVIYEPANRVVWSS